MDKEKQIQCFGAAKTKSHENWPDVNPAEWPDLKQQQFLL